MRKNGAQGCQRAQPFPSLQLGAPTSSLLQRCCGGASLLANCPERRRGMGRFWIRRASPAQRGMRTQTRHHEIEEGAHTRRGTTAFAVDQLHRQPWRCIVLQDHLQAPIAEVGMGLVLMQRVSPRPSPAARIAAWVVLHARRGVRRTERGASWWRKRHSLTAPWPPATMMRCALRSSGACGTPWRARYSGDAQITGRTVPTGRAKPEESGRAPMTRATSMPSSNRRGRSSRCRLSSRTSGKAAR